MCGLAGIWDADGNPSDGESRATLDRMLGAMRHRGPDGRRSVEGRRLAFGAVRLAVFDPERGAQPFVSDDGRLAVALNGAIVNHEELREELERAGVAFRTTCDTEVLLRLFEREGVEALGRLDGMFAVVLADLATGDTWLARDPCGVKPLHHARDERGRTVFASEIRALCTALPGRPRIDRDALLEYLAFQLPLGEDTLVEGVRRVLPGSVVHLSPEHGVRVLPLPQWLGAIDVPDDRDAAVALLRDIVGRSVQRQLRADVPLGCHLSGGVDSSLVQSLATRRLGPDVPAFVGAFERRGFDERPAARRVAEELGCPLHEVVITADDARESLPAALAAIDEPMAGPGLLPQWHVSRLASEHVRVTLTGHGGDELFGGYVRQLVLQFELALGAALDRGDAAPMNRLAPALRALEGYQPLLRRHFAGSRTEPLARRHFRLLHRGGELGSVLTGDLARELERYPAADVFEGAFHRAVGAASEDLEGVRAAVRFEQAVLLPALLHVEDRTSMAWSLESRVPLLGREVLAFVEACPTRFLLEGALPKSLLRDAAGADLPRAAAERSDKMGFPVPLTEWARDGLGDWVREVLLDPGSSRRERVDRAALERLLEEQSIEARPLWALLSLELWERSLETSA